MLSDITVSTCIRSISLGGDVRYTGRCRGVYFRNLHHIPRRPALASDVDRLCLVIGWLTLGSPFHPHPSLSLLLPSLPLAARPPIPFSLLRSHCLPPHSSSEGRFISVARRAPTELRYTQKCSYSCSSFDPSRLPNPLHYVH